MALLRPLQRNDRQPDPKGPLLSTIPPQAIARANQEVQAATDKDVQGREKGKRGAYTTDRYSPGEHADIGRYACEVLLKKAEEHCTGNYRMIDQDGVRRRNSTDEER